ncbi:hypothetical protein FRC09_013261 [Ceratobasidium sp. 395]|nr:hypothetical protein FRC09_013261 [Ceratobasidium sp. 395]
MQRITENQPIFLLSSHGPMFRSIINQLCPLEDPRYISATILTTSPQRISVELPRMKLTFFVNENQQLESDNFRGLVVDDSQSTGTMFGLYNQLVLCTKSLVEQLLPRSRCVLIPHGTVDFAAYGGHVHVTINHGSSQHIVFHQYKVDADLGCLAGSVGLTSRLFKLYLHALTSYFLPDPLTGRTGTEEALHELSEPSTSSFDEIDVEQAHLLQLIGGLTPKRSYYPIHLQSMMTTHWHDISPITQHYAFGIGANSILNRAHALRLFNSSNLDAEPFITNFDSTLLERAANRTRACYPLDIAIRLPTVAEKSGSSQTYVGRDSLATGWTEKAQVALWASNLVYAKWGTPIYAPHNLVSLAESWGIVRGPSYKGLVLTYSSNRLLLDLPQSWINLYNSCRQATIHSDKYKLCICLASATYSNQLPRNLVPTLLAFATNPQFSEIAPPSHPSYQLSDGYKPTRGRIRDILSARTRGVENTPAGQLRKKQNESTENWIQRKQNCFDANISELGNELARAWINDWQSFSFVPPLKYSSWFSIWSCTQQVRLYFNSCLKNLELATHLREVENTLTSRPATLGLGLQQTALHVAEPTQKTSGLTRFIGQPYLEELMQHRLCPNSANTPPGQALSISKGKGHAVNTTRLKSFLADFRDLSAPPLNQLYGTDLEASRVDLEKVDASLVSSRLQSPRQLEGNRHTQRGRLQDKFQEIRVALGPSTAIEAIVSTSGIWPRITPRAILGRLALWARASISPAWQKTLAEYARAYIEYQRSQRLINLAIEGKQDELSKELGSTSIASGPWNNHPDWLLVQVSPTLKFLYRNARS